MKRNDIFEDDKDGRTGWIVASPQGRRMVEVCYDDAPKRRVFVPVDRLTIVCDHSDTRVCQGMGHAFGPSAEPS